MNLLVEQVNLWEALLFCSITYFVGIWLGGYLTKLRYMKKQLTSSNEEVESTKVDSEGGK